MLTCSQSWWTVTLVTWCQTFHEKLPTTSSPPSCNCCLHSPQCKFKMHYRAMSVCLSIYIRLSPEERHIQYVQTVFHCATLCYVRICFNVTMSEIFSLLFLHYSLINIVYQRSTSRGRQKPFDCVERCGDRDAADQSWWVRHDVRETGTFKGLNITVQLQ